MENGFSPAGPNGFSSLADGFSILPLNQYETAAKRDVIQYRSFPNGEQPQSCIFSCDRSVRGRFNLIHTTGLTQKATILLHMYLYVCARTHAFYIYIHIVLCCQIYSKFTAIATMGQLKCIVCGYPDVIIGLRKMLCTARS